VGQYLKVCLNTLMRIHDLPLSVLFNLNLQSEVLGVFENILWPALERLGISASSLLASLEEEGAGDLLLRRRVGTQHAFILIASMIVPIPRRTNRA
jgi:hypothetical protein